MTEDKTRHNHDWVEVNRTYVDGVWVITLECATCGAKITFQDIK